LREHVGRSTSAVTSHEHLRKITKRGALNEQPVCALGDRNRLAGEPFGRRVLTARCIDPRLDMSPNRLRDDVVLITDFPAEVRKGLRLIVATQRQR
jgi:hypothetical protein